MIYLPSNVIPDGSVIDSSAENTFSLIFAGTKCLAYQFRIIDNNSYAEIYSSRKIVLDSPIYNGDTLTIKVPSTTGMINGNDYQWNIRLFGDLADQFIISGAVQEDTSSSQIKLRLQPSIKDGHHIQINGQKKIITSYNQSTGVAALKTAFGFPVKKGQQYQIYSSFGDSSNFYFKARSIATASIVSFPNPLEIRKNTFYGTYHQAQNVPIKYHIWNLYSASTGELIETTGKVYSEKLEFFFDGFMLDQAYMIELIVIDQNEESVQTPLTKFSVSYSQPDIRIKPHAEIDEKESRVHIKWARDRFSIGRPSNDCEYEFLTDQPFAGTNSVWIKKGSIEYNELSNRKLEIDDDYFTVFLNINFEDDKTGKIISLSNADGDEYYVEIFGCNFYSVKNNVRTFIRQIYFVNEWTLSVDEPQYDTGYIWDDNQVWLDNIDGVSQRWREPLTPLSAKQYKITILKDVALVEEVFPDDL